MKGTWKIISWKDVGGGIGLVHGAPNLIHTMNAQIESPSTDLGRWGRERASFDKASGAYKDGSASVLNESK